MDVNAFDQCVMSVFVFSKFQLLSKMAPLVGKDMVESLFLERFAALCVDPIFHVRKVCATNFGDFSSVVGSESTETVLVSGRMIYQ